MNISRAIHFFVCHWPVAFIVFILLVSSGCSPDPVEFKSITNARIISNNAQKAKVTADALFYNPNRGGGTVHRVDIVVTFKDQQVAHVVEVSSVKIKGRQDFTIPLDIDLDMQKIQNNWLGNLIQILQDKSVELHFSGSIKIRFHGISRSIPVDYTEKIKI